MADFAESVGGYRVNEFGSTIPLDNQLERLDNLRKRLARTSGHEGSLTWFLRRFLGIAIT